MIKNVYKPKRYVPLYIVLACILVLFASACKEHPHYEKASDVIEDYQAELKSLKKTNSADKEKIAEIASRWMEMQDSAFATFSRNDSITLRSPITRRYFTLSDSIRRKIAILAMDTAQHRSYEDVMYILIHSTPQREKVQKSDFYKKTAKFYENLDKKKLLGDLETTLAIYEKVLDRKNFNSKADLFNFIKEEDVCFRSLMNNLGAVNFVTLQELTQKTGRVLEGLYSSIGDVQSEKNQELMLVLTMRFNRRIVQNVQACAKEVKENERLTIAQRQAYRWMMLQPFLGMDNYSFCTLTGEQQKQLLEFSKELPKLMKALDGHSKDRMDNDATIRFLLKSFVISNL